MSGAIPPLPQYAFMAWCSVKAQGQLYLYLLDRYRVSENRVLRRIFRHKTGSNRRLERVHNEKLHNLYSSLNIIKVIKSRNGAYNSAWDRWEIQIFYREP
jgi:hypothetical protein